MWKPDKKIHPGQYIGKKRYSDLSNPWRDKQWKAPIQDMFQIHHNFVI